MHDPISAHERFVEGVGRFSGLPCPFCFAGTTDPDHSPVLRRDLVPVLAAHHHHRGRPSTEVVTGGVVAEASLNRVLALLADLIQGPGVLLPGLTHALSLQGTSVHAVLMFRYLHGFIIFCMMCIDILP